MENFNNQFCELLPHACNAGIEKPQAAVKAQIKPIDRHATVQNKNYQKPWSIFGDVYWI